MLVSDAKVWPTGATGFAVENGRFSQVGGDLKGGEWAGHTIMPGFIDAHCHILPTGLDLLKLNLSNCWTEGEVLDAVRDWLPNIEPGQWLHATQYDQNRWGSHLSRHQLDKLSNEVPILLRHSNGHASVANTAALRAAGVEHETPDMEGGEYVRDENGELTGVLLEKAHERVTSKAPEPSLDEMVAGILRAGESMAGYGITSATDMMTGRWDLAKELEAYRLASEQGCKIRLRMYMQWREVLGNGAIEPALLKDLMSAMDESKCKVLGLKVFADGAIGSATAAIYDRFVTTGGQGRLIYSPEKLAQIIADIDAAGWRCSVHTIGDRSTDLVMEAYEKTRDPKIHRIEHAMILSDAQIERMAKLGSHVTMQPEFLYRFGHAYRAQLPDGIWQNLKRVRSVLDAGISLSFNSDRPIVAGDPWDGIRSAANRPEGFSSAEAVSIEEGIDLYTHGGAIANFEEDELGMIEVGYRADFQVREGGTDGDIVAVYKEGVKVL